MIHWLCVCSIFPKSIYQMQLLLIVTSQQQSRQFFGTCIRMNLSNYGFCTKHTRHGFLTYKSCLTLITPAEWFILPRQLCKRGRLLSVFYDKTYTKPYSPKKHLISCIFLGLGKWLITSVLFPSCTVPFINSKTKETKFRCSKHTFLGFQR